MSEVFSLCFFFREAMAVMESVFMSEYIMVMEGVCVFKCRFYSCQLWKRRSR